MTILTLVGIVALAYAIFHQPAAIAFFVLAIVADEYSGAGAVIIVVISAIIYWCKNNPDQFCEALEKYDKSIGDIGDDDIENNLHNF